MAKGDKKRPKYIENILKEVNDDLRRRKVQDCSPYPYADSLFSFWTDYLLTKKWYKGWNIHVDRQVTFADGRVETIRALAGPVSMRDEKTNAECYVQIW